MFAWEAPYKDLALHPGVGQSLSEKKSPAECIFNQNANRWLGRLTDGKSNWLKWPEAKKSGAMRSATYLKLSTFQKLKNINPPFLDEKDGSDRPNYQLHTKSNRRYTNEQILEGMEIWVSWE